MSDDEFDMTDDNLTFTRWLWRDDPSWYVTTINIVPSGYKVRPDEVVVIIHDDITNIEVWKEKSLLDHYIPEVYVFDEDDEYTSIESLDRLCNPEIDDTI